jgi:hypothetical protein
MVMAHTPRIDRGVARAFSPLVFYRLLTQGDALGWYIVAPLVLGFCAAAALVL